MSEQADKLNSEYFIVKNSMFRQHGEILTDSISVAVVFHKPHRNVLRAIDNLRGGIVSEITPQLSSLIRFDDVDYVHPQNHQKYRKVIMNELGFMNLISNFKGTKVLEFKNMFFFMFQKMQKQPTKLPINRLVDRNKQLIEKNEQESHRKYLFEHHKVQQLEKENKKLRSQSQFFNEQMNNKGLMPVSIIAQAYGTNAIQFDKALHKIGIIYHKGWRWYLYKDFQNLQLADYYTQAIGKGNLTVSLHWTIKGKWFIQQMLKLKCNVTPTMENGLDFNQHFDLMKKLEQSGGKD